MSTSSLFYCHFRSASAVDAGSSQSEPPTIAARARTKSVAARKAWTASVAMATVTAMCAFGKVAYSGQYQPIGADLTTPIVPGQSLGVSVQLDGSSAPITIYSNPPGAVSYQGTINSGDTVAASTAPDIDPSTVTVYVITDGETVVALAAPMNAVPVLGEQDASRFTR